MKWLLLLARVPLFARKKDLNADWYDDVNHLIDSEETEVITRRKGLPGDLEMSRLFDIQPLVGKRRKLETILTPTAEELERISSRLGVSVHAFRSHVLMIGGDEVILEGTLEASLTQSCVITSRPVQSEISASFTIKIAQEDDDGLDDIITFDEIDGMLDVGELALQYFSLEIDPYPRAIPYSDEPIRL